MGRGSQSRGSSEGIGATEAGHRPAALLRLSADLAAAIDEREICERVVRGLRDESLGYLFVEREVLHKGTYERDGLLQRVRELVAERVAR